MVGPPGEFSKFGVLVKRMKTVIQKDMHSMFTAVLLTIAKPKKQPKFSYTHTHFLCSLIHWRINTYTRIQRMQSCHLQQREATRDYHTEWSKSERERWIKRYHLHVESRRWHKWTYLWNRNRLTDVKNRLVVAKGRGKRRTESFELADANYYIGSG